MKQLFGVLPNGIEVYTYTLTNKNGIVVKAINYGGIITSIEVPDKNGNFGDIVYGYDTLEGYLHETHYMGAIIGRCANRVANGTFTLENQLYNLPLNDNKNHHHGGIEGFNKKFWDIEKVNTLKGETLQLTYESNDGEEGYPGNLKVTVWYILTDSNELIIRYSAKTDKPTLVNFTNHSYFNLSAGKQKTVLNHTLKINAENYLPINQNLVPIGEFVTVEGTPFDYKNHTIIENNIDFSNNQIVLAGGLDHSFELVRNEGEQICVAAELRDLESGRVVIVRTTEPGIHVYTGNFLNDVVPGKQGILYQKNGAIGLETQHYPDSINHSNFPSVVLYPKQEYNSTTIFQFISSSVFED